MAVMVYLSGYGIRLRAERKGPSGEPRTPSYAFLDTP